VAALRLFLAIDIPPAVREALAEVQNAFRGLGLFAAWVPPGNIHLTIKFLGETHPGRVPGIIARMQPSLAALPRFSLSLGEIGVFPHWRNPRVLWVGLGDPENALPALKTRVEEEAAGLGYERDDRPNVPHLTLARLKSPRGKSSLKERAESLNRVEAPPFEVTEVALIESQLSSRGARYRTEARFALANR